MASTSLSCGMLDGMQEATKDDTMLRLAHVCGVLLAYPTTLVYAFSVEAPWIDIKAQENASLLFSFFGLSDGTKVDYKAIAFSKKTPAGVLAESHTRGYVIEESSKGSTATTVTTPRFPLATLSSRIYGKISFNPILCATNELPKEFELSDTSDAFERPVVELTNKDTYFVHQAQAYNERYGVDFSAAYLKEVTLVLRERTEMGLRIKAKLWDVDDFAMAYAIFLAFAEKWDLTTLPFPDKFACSLLEDRIQRERSVAFVRLQPRKTVLEIE